MLIKKTYSVIVAAMLLFVFSCKQSAPPAPVEVVEVGDLYFSGYYWNYKNATSPVGPGPNRFLGTSQGAWVDSAGSLHLTIQKINNVWYCSEIISTKEFDYGTYVFTSQSDISNFDKYLVFGLFTWNDYSFQTQGNSEIDVEFARWGVATDSLLVTYSAQPVSFSFPPFTERTYKPAIATNYLTQPMTHMMRWTPDSVYWETYSGEVYPGTNKLGSWSFKNTNPPRKKVEGGLTSNPIVIPAPEDSTNVRFNFWLLFGAPPTTGLNYEIVIKSFSYTPL